ncbi:MAG: pseudouridine-5'-phosphate glycosidase [Tateyamaria sp.]|nr:pseudouridine-5'-phosphate glycosidase [Tateyamaria sp.]MDG0982851.1 pseudouridine-5'-phosphate glycosidase [Tateyamaria sp.]MDG1420356.1 pseudouridine-5'-phosphate glycosidase [Tateyamaria sp.]
MTAFVPSLEISDAMATGKPIVALESTIITHGMPYPQNLEVAKTVENDIRKFGAVPATMAILTGTLHVGLTNIQLEKLAQSTGVAKLSRADIAACMASGGTGATTVAATMIVAHLAGIKVFATGGIGGVHKGAENTFDISADLLELAQTPVTVVSAGAKAILDIPKTLEILETQGVPVIAYGQNEMPAFWSRSSGIKAPLRMNKVEDIANAHIIRKSLGLPGGQLIANPIPNRYEINHAIIKPIINEAQKDADNIGITGKEVTPYLLQRIYELTEGRSLSANIGLVRNNAKLAAKIAIKLSLNAPNI